MDCKGGCKMKAGGKTCETCGCDMNKMRSGGSACMKCGGKMHKSGGTVSSCMKCGGGKYTFGGKVSWSKKKVNSNSSDKYASGGMIKRADGSYSERGLWDNIRDNAGSKKKPTKQMLKQEKKIKQKMAVGGAVDGKCPPGFVKDPRTGKCVQEEMIAYSDSTSLYNQGLKHYNRYTKLTGDLPRYTEFDLDKTQKFKEILQLAKENQGMVGVGADLINETIPTLNEARFKNILPTGYFGSEGVYTPSFKKPTKPAVRVPVLSVEETEKIIKRKKEKEENDAYEKFRAEYQIPEPSRKQEPDYYDKMYKTKYTPEDAKTIYNLKNKGLKRSGMFLDLTDDDKLAAYKRGSKFEQIPKKVAKGSDKGAIKSYFNGGQVGVPSTNTDQEIETEAKDYYVQEPAYDVNVLSNESPMQMTDNVTQGTEQLGYKEIVQSFRKKDIDKSLPNFGRAKQEQMKLNDLIRKDISTGNAKMDLLVEDDIIGDNTLNAMRAYESNNEYSRPELFKDKWLAEYKKQFQNNQQKTPIVTDKKTQSNQQEIPKSKTSPQKSESLIESMYSYFNKYKEKPKTESTDNTVNKYQPLPKSKAGEYSSKNLGKKIGGWTKASLLLEGGIEVNASDLKRKDFDSFFPISGITKSNKGIRATGRDNNRLFFDAVEKAQTKRKDGTNLNTSLQLIDKLLSSSKKVIVIPKGQDPYKRDLNDIYLQDPYYPDKFHALDSLGVVEGEAIFGMDIEPKIGSLSKRQEKITKQSKEKGGYKYAQSPSDYRKSK